MAAARQKTASRTLPLLRSEPHSCPYLPGLVAEDEFAFAHAIDPAAYEALLEQGFRRSGRLVYRPVCLQCRECRPLRVPVADFRPSRSQRRVARRNRDVTMRFEHPRCSDEKWRMYRDYLAYQHDGTMSDHRQDFERFLYDSPTQTLEMSYHVADRLVAVGIVDTGPTCLSSVYFFFDPAEARRSLGTYSALTEIAACRSSGRRYWYAGFFIRGCRRMSYKAHFRPYELLDRDGQWRLANPQPAPPASHPPPPTPESLPPKPTDGHPQVSPTRLPNA